MRPCIVWVPEAANLDAVLPATPQGKVVGTGGRGLDRSGSCFLQLNIQAAGVASKIS